MASARNRKVERLLVWLLDQLGEYDALDAKLREAGELPYAQRLWIDWARNAVTLTQAHRRKMTEDEIARWRREVTEAWRNATR